MLRMMLVVVTLGIGGLASAQLNRLPNVGTIEDTFVDMWDPNTDHGVYNFVAMGTYDYRQAYFKFDLNGVSVPQNHQVAYAVLHLVWVGVANGGNIEVHEANSNDWNDHMLWADRVGYKPTILNSIPPSFLVYLDVTGAVRAALAEDKILSLVTFCAGNDTYYYGSSEYSDAGYHPWLEIFTEEQPTLRGTMVPVGYGGDKSRILVGVTLVRDGAVVKAEQKRLDVDGQFTLEHVEAGDYTLIVRSDCWLTAVRDVTVNATPTLVDNIVLTPADGNGDDTVNFGDFSILQNNYGQSGGAAAAVTPRTAVVHDVDGQLAAGEWATLYSDPVSDKPGDGCVELVRWGVEVRDGILYGAFELNPAGPTVADYDQFVTDKRLWLGLWIDADPAASPATGVAGGADQFTPRVQDINIELGMDKGPLVSSTAEWNSLNFWGRDNSFDNITPVTVNAAYQGHVVEFAVPVADIMAELARTDGAVPGNVWRIGARAAGHVSGEDYNGDTTDLQSVTILGIEGAIALQGYLGDNTRVGVGFEFALAGGGAAITRTAILNANGTFRLDPVPVGTYNVTIRSGTSLSAVLSTVSVGASVTDLGMIELKNADFNGDDRISFEDFSLLQNSYGQSGATGGPLSAVATGGCGGLGITLLSFLGPAFCALRLRNE